MDFEQEKRVNDNEKKYHIENLTLVREFSKKLILEMRSLVKSIVLFGSNTHDTLEKDSDIDIMIILDNVSVYVSDELREAYRIMTNNLTQKYPNKFHIMTVNFSDFWNMARKGDPVLINVLRYGLPIYDTNLVEPMQYLLETGKIKPSRETVNNYMARSTSLLDQTKKHLHDAIMDLYYSAIDMVHSTLIIEGVMPPSPKEMPEIFKETFKGKTLAKHFKTIDELYKVAKEIEHKNPKKMDGKYYDELEIKTVQLVDELKKYNLEQLSKKDIFDL